MSKGLIRKLIPAAVLLFILLVVSFIFGAIGSSLFGITPPEWLAMHQPSPELPAETIFYIFGIPITNSIIGCWIGMLALALIFWVGTRSLKLIPARFQGGVEFILGGFLLNFCQSVAGEKNGRRFFPVVATIFLFVIANSWVSLIPGFGSITVLHEGHAVHLFRGANTDINTPLALALISFVFVEYMGISSLKLHYLTKFFNFGKFFGSLGMILTGKIKQGLSGVFTGIIDIFVGILELLSEFIRIVSFTFRLFGNMTAGEILLLIIAFLVPWVVSSIFYGFELLVGFIQALIFSALTLIFANMAVTSHEAEAESH